MSWIFSVGWQRFEQWFGIGLDYVIAVILILGGLYIAYVFSVNPLSRWFKFLGAFRVIGYALTVGGFVLGAVTYGKQVGATDCEARWKSANLQAQLDRAKQETEAQKRTAELAAQQSEDLEKQNLELQQRVQAYDDYLAKVRAEQEKSPPVAGCALTSDDVLQLRDIAGTGSLSRKNPK